MRLSKSDYEDLRRRRPNLFPADPGDCNTGLPASDTQPAQRNALVGPAPGEDSRWYGSAKRFTVRFVIYAVRPADWDNWHVKELVDSLVAAKLIPDDGWKTVEEGSVATRKVHKASEERTEITITPI